MYQTSNIAVEELTRYLTYSLLTTLSEPLFPKIDIISSRMITYLNLEDILCIKSCLIICTATFCSPRSLIADLVRGVIFLGKSGLSHNVTVFSNGFDPYGMLVIWWIQIYYIWNIS